jgi:hypothetical protein
VRRNAPRARRCQRHSSFNFFAALAAELLGAIELRATLIAEHLFLHFDCSLRRLLMIRAFGSAGSACETNAAANEKATRQQGGLFFRENSSNGGKTVKTF